MFYRFNDGSFVEADTFEQAKEKKISQLCEEKENKLHWYNCTCCGLEHRYTCPENPWNKKDEIPF